MADGHAPGSARGGLLKDLERKLFWYQDAIHEQELQKQLLEAIERAARAVVVEAGAPEGEAGTARAWLAQIWFRLRLRN